MVAAESSACSFRAFYIEPMAATISSLLAINESSVRVYERLTKARVEMGPYTVDEKKTSLHIAAGKAAFLEVPSAKSMPSPEPGPVTPPRKLPARKIERVSAKRFHNEVEIREAEGMMQNCSPGSAKPTLA